VPSQICITKDNTQLQVDGILYFQVTDPKLASYGSSNFELAITQLAQTTLRSVIGRMELDRTFEERDHINGLVVAALDEAARNWGVKVLRYEIKDLTPPKEILHAMQAQITAEREKRAVIAASEGRRQEQINIATGQREASIARSEGEKQAEINKAQGEAAAILAIAAANATAIRQVAEAISADGGINAVNLKIAEQYIAAFGNLAKEGNNADRALEHGGSRQPGDDCNDRIEGGNARRASTRCVTTSKPHELRRKNAMQIRNHVFLITGGASGLGAGTARMIVGQGGKAVLADLRDEEGRALATELGASAQFCRTDVTDESSVEAAVGVATAMGELRGLVSCAGDRPCRAHRQARWSAFAVWLCEDDRRQSDRRLQRDAPGVQCDGQEPAATQR
jgi:regulator of protease activity HflC (stomatin/prohibitin superfamily)